MQNFQQYLIQERKAYFLRLDIEILDNSSYKEMFLFRKTEHLSPMNNMRNDKAIFYTLFFQILKRLFSKIETEIQCV